MSEGKILHDGLEGERMQRSPRTLDLPMTAMAYKPSVKTVWRRAQDLQLGLSKHEAVSPLTIQRTRLVSSLTGAMYTRLPFSSFRGAELSIQAILHFALFMTFPKATTETYSTMHKERYIQEW
jgi:hypothetical protein